MSNPDLCMETKALKGLRLSPVGECPSSALLADWLLLLSPLSAPTVFSQKEKVDYLPSKSQIISGLQALFPV